jgi:iron complex transport system substrate-binding protein
VLRVIPVLLLLVSMQPADALRVATLSPHATELVWFAGGGDQLVGVSAFSDFPESASNLPSIGDASAIDRERIISLDPELLVYWSNGIRPSDLAWLKERGIALFASNPVTIDELVNELHRLAKLLETEESARKSIETIREKQQQLQARDTGVPVHMIHQLWGKPLIVLGKQDLLPQTLRLCGIENPIGTGGQPSAAVSREYLHAVRADIILVAEEALFEPFNPHDLPLLRGDGNRMHRATPRLLDAALDICRKVRNSSKLPDLRER